MNGVPGNSGHTITYLYDSKGNCIEKRYKSDFENHSELLRYNAQNKLTSRSYAGANGVISSSTKFRYDNNGHKLLEDYKDGAPNGNSGITNFMTDNRGNILQETAHFPDGRTRYYKAYTYDLKNNMTNEYCYTAEGRLYWQKNYTIEYDNLGNWTKITSFSSSETLQSIRYIEYF